MPSKPSTANGRKIIHTSLVAHIDIATGLWPLSIDCNRTRSSSNRQDPQTIPHPAKNGPDVKRFHCSESCCGERRAIDYSGKLKLGPAVMAAWARRWPCSQCTYQGCGRKGILQLPVVTSNWDKIRDRDS